MTFNYSAEPQPQLPCSAIIDSFHTFLIQFCQNKVKIPKQIQYYCYNSRMISGKTCCNDPDALVSAIAAANGLALLLSSKSTLFYWAQNLLELWFHLLNKTKGPFSLVGCAKYYKIDHFLATTNGILLPKLFWPTVRKKNTDWEKLLEFEAESREFEIILRSLEQFIQTVKGQNNFLVAECFFNLFLEVSHI